MNAGDLVLYQLFVFPVLSHIVLGLVTHRLLYLQETYTAQKIVLWMLGGFTIPIFISFAYRLALNLGWTLEFKSAVCGQTLEGLSSFQEAMFLCAGGFVLLCVLYGFSSVKLRGWFLAGLLLCSSGLSMMIFLDGFSRTNFGVGC